MKAKILDHTAEKYELPFPTSVARRKFLVGLGALGAAAVLPDAFLQGQVPAAVPGRPYRIDVHNHFSAPGFIAAIA
jgi:hypothetical protein